MRNKISEPAKIKCLILHIFNVSFRCLSLSETQHWLKEDRQEGDEKIYGWPDHKLLHLSSPWMFDQNDHPSSNSRSSLGLWLRSVVEKPGVTAVLPNARGSKVRPSCFYEGDIVGWVGLGLGPGSRWVVEGLVWQFSPGGNSLSVYPSRFGAGHCITRSHDTYCLLPEERHGTHGGQRERTNKQLKDWDCAYKQHGMAGKIYSDISCPLTDAL